MKLFVNFGDLYSVTRHSLQACQVTHIERVTPTHPHFNIVTRSPVQSQLSSSATENENLQQWINSFELRTYYLAHITI